MPAACMMRDGFFCWEKNMDLTINGQAEAWPTLPPDTATLADLLHLRGHGEGRVVVELNGSIVPAADFTATRLHNGDTVEIVQFVGGG